MREKVNTIERGIKMATANTIESLASDARPQNIPSEELEPVTLQVVLLGSDGVVIASDTRAVNFNPRVSFPTTDTVSKIVVVEPHLVYLFAGDDCAKEVGAAVVRAVAESAEPLSANLIDEVSNRTLDDYRARSGSDRVDYRKIIWVQATNDGFIVWSALCEDRADRFVVRGPSTQNPIDGKFRVFAGNEFNQARCIVEHYYDKYPLRNVSGLKRLAAHTILTGEVFNSAGVSGLEMVVGNNESGAFERVSDDKIRELAKLSRQIHDETDAHFRD